MANGTFSGEGPTGSSNIGFDMAMTGGTGHYRGARGTMHFGPLPRAALNSESNDDLATLHYRLRNNGNSQLFSTDQQFSDATPILLLNNSIGV